jgi:hypothetical protein
MKHIKKPFLVGIFIYFASMMIVLGNGSSFLGRSLGNYFTPVANMVGLNTTWNFFSPDPAHTMYLRYTVHFEDEYGNPVKESIQKLFPPEETNNDFRVHVRRMAYVMRFYAASADRLGEFLIPWLCKKNPGATRIQTDVLYNRIPSLEVAATLADSNYEDLVKQEEINQYVFPCK